LFANPRNTHPEWSLQPRPRQHFHAALERDGAGTGVEHHAGLDGRATQQQRRRIAEDDAAPRDRIAVPETGCHVFREEDRKYAHQIEYTVQHDAAHFDGERAGLRPVPRRAGADAPADRHPVAGEPERAVGERRRDAAGHERRGADERRPRHRVPRRHEGHARLDEAREVGEREDFPRLRAEELLPALAYQVRAGLQL